LFRATSSLSRRILWMLAARFEELVRIIPSRAVNIPIQGIGFFGSPNPPEKRKIPAPRRKQIQPESLSQTVMRSGEARRAAAAPGS